MSIKEKEQAIIQYLEQNDCSYIKLNDQDIIDVYDGLFDNKFKDDANGIVNNYYGLYYRHKNDYDKMINYYSLAASLGNAIAVVNLANYYRTIKDFDNMIKYYLMAIELNEPLAMVNLANYYRTIKDYDNMIKYYLMAAELGDDNSMNSLGYYYLNIKDYDNMMIYLTRAIISNNPSAMSNLGYYYFEIKDYDNMMIYLTRAITLNNASAMITLGGYYRTIADYDNMIKYFIMAINFGNFNSIAVLINDKNYSEYKIKFITELFKEHKEFFDNKECVFDILYHIEQHNNIDDNILEIIAYVDIKYFTKCSKFLLLSKRLLMEKIELIDLHFHYSPDNQGCLAAKQDFIERLV